VAASRKDPPQHLCKTAKWATLGISYLRLVISKKVSYSAASTIPNQPVQLSKNEKQTSHSTKLSPYQLSSWRTLIARTSIKPTKSTRTTEATPNWTRKIPSQKSKNIKRSWTLRKINYLGRSIKITNNGGITRSTTRDHQ